MYSLPKLILTDIDGVWTDGGMTYDTSGGESKRFNTSDSAGVLFAKLLNIPVGIVTGEETSIVKQRADKLGLNILHMGVKNKLSIAMNICDDLGISLSEVAYIGDDINDVRLLEVVGFSACPLNAPSYIQDIVDYVTSKKGGDGAFREFVEYILSSNNVSVDFLLKRYHASLESFKQ